MSSLKGKLKIGLFEMLPVKTYLKICFRKYHGRPLDFDDPKTYSEKLFWLKLFNGENCKETVQRCYDKFTAREYIKEKVGEKYLPKLYGVYNSVEDIDFTALPSKYAIKVTQSCGYNIINDGKHGISIEEVKRKLNGWLHEVRNLKECRRKYKEEAYCFNGQAKIICEEYLEDKNGLVCTDSGFFCFNGVPKFYDIVYDSVDFETGIKIEDFPRNVYDMDGNFMPVSIGRPTNEALGRREYKNFREMEAIAAKLSEGFPFMRVDLYNIDGRVVVGELTFIPQGGCGRITPVEYDRQFGQWLELPRPK